MTLVKFAPTFYLMLFVFSLSGCVTFSGRSADSQPIAQPPTSSPPSTQKERTFSTYIEDEKLEANVKKSIEKSHHGFSDARFNVYCFNGVVLITGEVPNRELQHLAGTRAQQVDGVKEVHNQLLIKSNSTFFSRTNDNWIASRVRLNIMGLDEVESERVKVIVDNRVVYLMGLLSNKEAKLVSEAAAKVSGVEKVVRVFE